MVASFYPVYICSFESDGRDGGSRGGSLTQPQTGCLHDFQLSPENMIALTGADALLINGAGAEAFLDQVAAQLPDLPVVDSSQGIELLPAGHVHEHDEEEEEEDVTMPMLFIMSISGPVLSDTANKWRICGTG